ncbi:hypothetical protein GE09DRAFT_1214488 [Coniochaeta sp. 2T2.1]|nr:hypothetical protein GE09DRAFT_1214488 [Coniochaeta sp. 2T2.1]
MSHLTKRDATGTILGSILGGIAGLGLLLWLMMHFCLKEPLDDRGHGGGPPGFNMPRVPPAPHFAGGGGGGVYGGPYP